MTRMARLRSGGVQPGIPVFFYGYANAHSCSWNSVPQRYATSTVRQLNIKHEWAVRREPSSIRRAASTKIERQTREGGRRSEG